jgi:hypothetical protein
MHGSAACGSTQRWVHQRSEVGVGGGGMVLAEGLVPWLGGGSAHHAGGCVEWQHTLPLQLA